jgi:hypothetical protein
MIEAYAFLAAFTVQILATSVLYPAWFSRYIREQATLMPAERVAQLYPDVDIVQAQERFLTWYRALNTGIVILGLLLLVGFFIYLRRPDWNDGPLGIAITAHFLVARMLPLGLLIWLGLRFDKKHKHSLPPEGKRKAMLQRRGLFDFVSPVAVAVAVLGYFLFAAFVFYLQQHPFLGFAGRMNIGIVTLLYAVMALVIYTMVYGSHKKGPLETHAARQHAIDVTVKSGVYTCIAVITYLSLNFSFRLLDLQRWEPFVLSVFFVICSLLGSMGVIPRQPTRHAAGATT